MRHILLHELNDIFALRCDYKYQKKNCTSGSGWTHEHRYRSPLYESAGTNGSQFRRVESDVSRLNGLAAPVQQSAVDMCLCIDISERFVAALSIIGHCQSSSPAVYAKMNYLCSLTLLAVFAKTNAFLPRGYVTTRIASPTVTGINTLRNSALNVASDVTTPVEPENYKFESNVSRVMDIIINSLYSNKDVFVRELVRLMIIICKCKHLHAF